MEKSMIGLFSQKAYDSHMLRNNFFSDFSLEDDGWGQYRMKWNPTTHKFPKAVIYSAGKGNEVLCTCVCTEEQISRYRWDDTVNLGEVKQYIRGIY